MAKDILHIDDGAAVDVAWTGHIVISADGSTWNGINIAGLSASLHNVNFNTTATNSYPERNKETGWVIVLKHKDSDGAVLKFNPENVTNQAGWIGDPQQALSDILDWLA